MHRHVCDHLAVVVAVMLLLLLQVCNDAVAIFFMFDLSRKSTLNSVKEWYRQVRQTCSAHSDRRV